MLTGTDTSRSSRKGDIAATMFAGTMLLVIQLAALTSTTEAADLCWTPRELRNIEGAQVIRQNVPTAFVPLPRAEVPPPPPGFRPIRGVIRRVNLPEGAPKLVALTFDLCEQAYEIAGYQGRLVDYLRDNSVRATFFVGGKWMLTHQTRAEQLMSDPLFEVANHTWEHRNLRIVSGGKLDDEIRGAQAAYEILRERLVKKQCLNRDGKAMNKATPARMSLFRFPFGACNPKALEAVRENGLLGVQWDISSADPDRRLSGPAMAEAVLKQVRSGSIVLFHANGRGWSTADALPRIVSELAKNFQFVTVSELLKYPGAKWDISESCYNSRPRDTERYDGLAHALEASYQRFYSRFAPSQGSRDDSVKIAPAKGQ